MGSGKDNHPPVAKKLRIYCAGPLFNGKEREEMLELATGLEQAGYLTFLPQRDGLELSRCVEALLTMGYSRARASQLMAQAIFALDVYQVLRGCDLVVANLNGRVPDEGTISEAAMAWSRGKFVVGFKTDSRSLVEGQDNPLVLGLFGFRTCRTIEEVLKEVSRGAARSHPQQEVEREKEIQAYLKLGRDISLTWRKDRRIDGIAALVAGHGEHLMSDLRARDSVFTK